MIFFTDIVTCVSLDRSSRRLISGSRDTTCMIWEIVHQVSIWNLMVSSAFSLPSGVCRRLAFYKKLHFWL